MHPKCQNKKLKSQNATKGIDDELLKLITQIMKK